MAEVEIDPIVLYLLALVCCFAFTPPAICKLKQMLCNGSRVADYEADDDEDK